MGREGGEQAWTAATGTPAFLGFPFLFVGLFTPPWRKKEKKGVSKQKA